MRIVRSNLATATICSLAGIISTATIIGAATSSISTSALSYSTSSDVSFTFAPTLSIGLSTDSLTIDNLVPGTTSDSNKVSVTVSSNTPYGYVLSAGVGSNDTTSPYYNTPSLTHENTTISNVFSSVDTNASLDSLDTDNTWGYSTSTNGGTSWSTYSGLSNTTTKPLLDISDPATPSTIDFKIAARSATTQASGTYNNVITFYAVGKPKPPDYMQEPEIIKTKLKNVGDELQAIDQRDGKEYWVARLADGKIWMTQNLDLDLNSRTELTPANTDISDNWTPVNTTISFTDTRVYNWQSSSFIPYSADPGERYVYTSGTTADDSQYYSLAACQAEHPDCSMHNHIGNYYNWSAAVASNNTSSLATKFDNAPDSICPAGWRLPIGRNSADTTVSREWNVLLYAEGIVGSRGNSYTQNGLDKMRTAPLWLTRSGTVGGQNNYFQLHSFGVSSLYWSSTIFSVSYVYPFFAQSSNIIEAVNFNVRTPGSSVRCLVK